MKLPSSIRSRVGGRVTTPRTAPGPALRSRKVQRQVLALLTRLQKSHETERPRTEYMRVMRSAALA